MTASMASDILRVRMRLKVRVVRDEIEYQSERLMMRIKVRVVTDELGGRKAGRTHVVYRTRTPHQRCGQHQELVCSSTLIDGAILRDSLAQMSFSCLSPVLAVCAVNM